MTGHHHQLLHQLIPLLEGNDTHGAVALATQALQSGTITVAQLYEEVLAPALNRIEVPREREAELIWREHLQSSIVQKIIGSVYPFVLAARERSDMPGKGMRVLLASPQEEYHEIGARMGADFFFMLGYEVAYIGSNTPKETLFSAVEETKPDLVVLSVTNYLNLAQLPSTLEALRKRWPQMKVYLGGSALKHTGMSAADFLADGTLNSYDDIKKIAEAGR